MKTTNLSLYREDPDNVSTATDAEIARLAGKIRRNPRGLAAMRIAYVTDAPGGGRMVNTGSKRLRVLKQIAADGGLKAPASCGEAPASCGEALHADANRDPSCGEALHADANRDPSCGEALHADADAWLVSPSGDVPAEWFCDITFMTPAQRKEFRLNTNISDGSFDAEKLLAQYTRDDLAALMSADAIDELCKQAEKDDPKDGQTDADAVPEAPETPVSKRGEVYICGEHRLMCGDATSSDDVARLMDGEKADMVFTDPPYNVSIGDRNKAINEVEKKRGQKNLGGRIEQNILGDFGMSDEECGEKLWRPAFQNAADNSADYAAIYVTMPQGGTHMMMMMMMRGSWQVKHELMWLKNMPTFSMGRLDYDYKHEPICYGWKKSHRFFGKGDFTKSVWEFDKPVSSKLHPTMKPVALVENALKNSSQKGEVILDLFGGSGTTMIAAESLGRKARLMELDPHYCDVIRKRWGEFAHGKGCDWKALTPCATPAARSCKPC